MSRVWSVLTAVNAYKRSHCCGRGVPFPCGVGQTFGGVGRFGGLEASQTAALKAYKRSHCCGRGVLLSHCCGLVVAFACSVGVAKVQERDALTTERYAGKRPARHFKGLKPVKRQP